MKLFKKDLVLTKDTTFKESIKVEGDIRGKDGKRFNLTVKGNITARNIDAWNIDAGNIDAGNITAGNIDAWNITAMDIDAGNITAMDIDAGNIDAGNIT
ncbi:MAG: hypothetical protein KKF27_19965, partial [Gammaproteobacteria bacterium]|nr:hypothetical protein [Gammaproteobacteria bacterium]